MDQSPGNMEDGKADASSARLGTPRGSALKLLRSGRPRGTDRSRIYVLHRLRAPEESWDDHQLYRVGRASGIAR